MPKTQSLPRVILKQITIIKIRDCPNNLWIRQLPTISDKSYEKNCCLDNFVFLHPSPSQQCWETMNKSCYKLCHGFATLYTGRVGILNTLFKIPIIFCNKLSEIYKRKRKMRFSSCCFEKEPDYVTVHSHEHNDSKRCQNGAKNAATMFLRY